MRQTIFRRVRKHDAAADPDVRRSSGARDALSARPPPRPRSSAVRRPGWPMCCASSTGRSCFSARAKIASNAFRSAMRGVAASQRSADRRGGRTPRRSPARIPDRAPASSDVVHRVAVGAVDAANKRMQTPLAPAILNRPRHQEVGGAVPVGVRVVIQISRPMLLDSSTSSPRASMTTSSALTRYRPWL